MTLEELGLPYEVRAISLSEAQQKEEWFTRINPNARIPAREPSSLVSPLLPASNIT